MLLLLGVKFLPDNESEQESEEEPEFHQCHIDRHISEKIFQPAISNGMTPLAQANLEHGQVVQSSNIEHEKLPEDHVINIDSQQGSMAPPTAFSSDQLIDPQMSLDP